MFSLLIASLLAADGRGDPGMRLVLSGSPGSEGVIFRHGNLLVNKKTLARIRGESACAITRFHPICPVIFRTSPGADNGASRWAYLQVRSTLRLCVLHPARGWFSALPAGEDSQSTVCSPCRPARRVLVPVKAFLYSWSLTGDPVGGIGLEPTTSAMSKQCSNQLSYPPDCEGIL